MTPDFLTTAEAAKIARVAPVTIRRHADRGEFPAIRAGSKLVRIPRKEFMRWLFGDADA